MTMTMKKIISLEKKKTRLSFRPHLALTMLVGGMLALVMTQAPSADARRYSDWSAPVNLGPVINSASNDNGPSYFENGDEDSEHDGEDEEGTPQLYFGSDRPGGLGLADIYMSEQTAAGCFGPAVLVTELSSPMAENAPSIRRDGLEIFFHSNRTGSIGLNDLWVGTRESTHDAWSTPVNLGATINTAFADQQPYLSSDNTTLFFASDRPGGFGGQDLYMITRTKLRGHHDDDDRDRDDH